MLVECFYPTVLLFLAKIVKRQSCSRPCSSSILKRLPNNIQNSHKNHFLPLSKPQSSYWHDNYEFFFKKPKKVLSTKLIHSRNNARFLSMICHCQLQSGIGKQNFWHHRKIQANNLRSLMGNLLHLSGQLRMFISEKFFRSGTETWNFKSIRYWCVVF